MEASQGSAVSLATSAWVPACPLHTHLICPSPVPGAASPGDAQGRAVADHRVGVAGNSHCPHCRDGSPGRSQAAWAESPEEEGRTAGPRHSECLILGRRGGTASLNLQTSLSGMLHPLQTLGLRIWNLYKSPRLCPSSSSERLIGLPWGLAGSISGQENTAPTGPRASTMSSAFHALP